MTSTVDGLHFISLNKCNLGRHLPEMLSIISQDKWAHWNHKMLSAAIEAGSEIVLLKKSMATIGVVILDMRSIEAELHYLVIDKAFQRKGFAKKLLNYVVNQARKNKSAAVFLEVRANNFAAISLYKSNGFAVVGIRPGYYSFSAKKQDALVMCYDFVS